MGTASDDILLGTVDADELSGHGGMDLLKGLGGNDLLEGGEGNDILKGGKGEDILNGGEGDDRLDGGSGVDSIDGGEGNDTVVVTAADAGILDDVWDSGTSGIDTVDASAVRSAQLTSSFSISSRFEVIVGNPEFGTILKLANLFGAPVAWDFTNIVLTNITAIVGTDARDDIYGSFDNDIIKGKGGSDYLYGEGGDDRIAGGAGVDWLEGGVGDDTLKGGAGADTLVGSDGDDALAGGRGFDTLIGGAGIDLLKGGAGPDLLDGGAGNDLLTGGVGNDGFLFDDELSVNNIDVIIDFGGAGTMALDVIHLDNTIFAALAGGALAGAAFESGAGLTAAANADGRIVYDTDSGALYYDADGVGGDAAIQFAVIVTAVDGLSADDFLVI